MFLQLNHKNLDVYSASRELLKGCYRISKILPADERFNLVQQIRSAALSVKLNIAEGSSRKSSNERKRYYEIARGSVIEIDSIAESINDLEYLRKESMQNLGIWLIKCFSMLCKMLI